MNKKITLLFALVALVLTGLMIYFYFQNQIIEMFVCMWSVFGVLFLYTKIDTYLFSKKLDEDHKKTVERLEKGNEEMKAYSKFLEGVEDVDKVIKLRNNER